MPSSFPFFVRTHLQCGCWLAAVARVRCCCCCVRHRDSMRRATLLLRLLPAVACCRWRRCSCCTAADANVTPSSSNMAIAGIGARRPSSWLCRCVPVLAPEGRGRIASTGRPAAGRTSTHNTRRWVLRGQTQPPALNHDSLPHLYHPIAALSFLGCAPCRTPAARKTDLKILSVALTNTEEARSTWLSMYHILHTAIRTALLGCDASRSVCTA